MSIDFALPAHTELTCTPCRQLYFTGQFICVILRCIFSSFTSIPNDIPASQGITTQEMLGFFLAFCVTIPFAFVHTSKIYPRE